MSSVISDLEHWNTCTEEAIQGMVHLLEGGEDFNFMRNVVPGILRAELRLLGMSDEQIALDYGDMEMLADLAKARFDARRSD